ncbi:unnamed protein product [Pylaiella littoralis]
MGDSDAAAAAENCPERLEQEQQRLQEHQQQQEQQEQLAAQPPNANSPRSLPHDVLETVFCFFPATQALRCARTSRAFSRASLASLQSATWLPDPGVTDGSASTTTAATAAAAWDCGAHGHSSCSNFSNSDLNGSSNGSASDGSWSGIRSSSGVALGTPCLDLRGAGDSMDFRTLLALLQRVFDKTVAKGGGGGKGESVSGSSGSAARGPVGRHAILKGLAVCSTAVQDEAMEQVLTVHGEGLEVLDLAGCRGLDMASTLASIRQGCKRLVTLNLSGPFGEGTKPSSGFPFGEAFPDARGQHPESGTAFGRWGGPRCAADGSVLFQKDGDRLRNCHLASLLSAVGGGLLSLTLRNRPDITDNSVGAIAASCTQLRELDIGTESRVSESGTITGQALGSLSVAPLARSLLFLGLRNRHSIGHLDLRDLGTKFPSLSRLDLASLVKVDDDVLKALASTLSLSHIDLSRAHRVSVTGVTALALATPELECISLHGTNLSDGAIRALCEACPKLRHINVSMTHMTERSLRLLAEKDSLSWANVRCCPGLLDNDSAEQVLADFRSRLSAPKHPRDRGTVLGMERPESQLRGRPPSRSLRRPPSGCRTAFGYQGGFLENLPRRSSNYGQAAVSAVGPIHPFAPVGGDGVGGSDGGGTGDTIDAHTPPGGGGVVSCSEVPLVANVGGGSGAAGGSVIQGRAVRTPAVEGSAGESHERTLVPLLSSSSQSVSSGAVERGTAGDREARNTIAQEGKERAHTTGAAGPTAQAVPIAVGAPAASALSLSALAPAAKVEELAPSPATAPSSPSPAPPAAAALPARLPPSPPPTAAAAEEAGESGGDHPLPLLPAGVGDLSLGRHHSRGRAQRRGGGSNSSLRAVGTTAWHSAAELPPGRITWSGDGRHDRRGHGEGARRWGGREGGAEEMQGMVMPFDWDAVPRGSGVGGLRAWKGFRGLSGDLVRRVIQELHPYAQVEFRAKSDPSLGPPTRKVHHGHLVHTSKWGQAWVEFEVDGQGCVT